MTDAAPKSTRPSAISELEDAVRERYRAVSGVANLPDPIATAVTTAISAIHLDGYVAAVIRAAADQVGDGHYDDVLGIG